MQSGKTFFLHADVKERTLSSSMRSIRVLFPFMFYHDAQKGMVGLTRLELVTPRLSSACSNQLSYRPFLLVESWWLKVESKILNSHWQLLPSTFVGGGTGTRTLDIQLAKLALYQLSYTPLPSERRESRDKKLNRALRAISHAQVKGFK